MHCQADQTATSTHGSSLSRRGLQCQPLHPASWQQNGEVKAVGQQQKSPVKSDMPSNVCPSLQWMLSPDGPDTLKTAFTLAALHVTATFSGSGEVPAEGMTHWTFSC